MLRLRRKMIMMLIAADRIVVMWMEMAMTLRMWSPMLRRKITDRMTKIKLRMKMTVSMKLTRWKRKLIICSDVLTPLILKP